MRTKQRIRGMRWGAAALFAVVILLGTMGSQRVFGAEKPVKKITIKAGECYDIILTKKCTGLGNARKAQLTVKKSGTKYDAIFYSGSAGNSSIMMLEETKKKQSLELDYLGGGFHEKNFNWEGDPKKQLLATIQVKKGSMSFSLTGGFSKTEPVTFIARKVNHSAYRTYLLKKGNSQNYSLAKDPGEFRPTSIEAIFKGVTGDVLTFSGTYEFEGEKRTWTQKVAFKKKNIKVKEDHLDAKGKIVGGYEDTWNYKFTRKTWHYLQYINVSSFGKISVNKTMEMIVPYAIKLKIR